ncbi:MAG: thiamine-phosphate kinase [Usitatibacteraceae bacterium]
MSPEFALIAKYFTRPVKNATLGIGDDCALVSVPAGRELAISTDTLASGTHFFADADPEAIGHKALAVNLSDLAAMGATPRYVTLALTLPSIDGEWLAAFARGFFALAEELGVELIGGDTTRGPLSITLTVLGEVASGQALRREGAHEGDDVWVSGDLGGAALALASMEGRCMLPANVFASAAERLHKPSPRVTLGRRLLGFATSAIDLSDGLVADLTHICERSGLAAHISWPQVPRSAALDMVAPAERIFCALSGGDDYELCFTAPQSLREDLHRISVDVGLQLTRIGRMLAGPPRVAVLDETGPEMRILSAGFDHFAKRG